MKNERREPTIAAAPWDGVLLVCKACAKRSNGPKKGLKAKAIVVEARSLLRSVRPRPRVLATTCLGLCPKAAVAVARVGGKSESRIAPVASLAELARLLPLLGA